MDGSTLIAVGTHTYEKDASLPIISSLKAAILAEQGDYLIGTVEREYLFELMDQLVN